MCCSHFHYFVVFSAQNWENQQTITCSNSTIETIKNRFKFKNKDTRTTLFYTLWKHQKTRDFLIFSGGIEKRHAGVFIVNIEQIL